MMYAGTSNKTLDTFATLEQELLRVHNCKYTYDSAVFVNARTPFLITCPKHGDFLQQPRAHKRGQGCRQCFFEVNSEGRKKSKELVSEQLESAVGHKFVVDHNFEYTNAYSRANMRCKKCGVTSNKSIYMVLFHAPGCLECAKRSSTWGPSRYEGVPALLYYIKVGNLFKIGITKTSITTRYKDELSKGMGIEVIFTVEYKNGVEAFKEEQRILKDYAAYRYYGDKVFERGGDSELFTVDIFNMEDNHHE